ncbi:MAG: hypothetical protein JWN31_1377 [Frankiales bacterium]|nr:hypothetical protein [Frankiales bacterium]
MERGSDKHSARMDDALSAEVDGITRSGHDNRAEWNTPEPSGEDQPDVDRVPNGTMAGGVPDGMTEADVERRSELASYLGRVWPATKDELIAIAHENNAPEAVLADLDQLPADWEFQNLQDAWTALSGGAVEQHRF